MAARRVIRRDGGIGCIGQPTVSAVFQTVPSAQVPQAIMALFIFIQVGASLGIAISALILQRSQQAGDLAHASSDAFGRVFAASNVVMVASLMLPEWATRADSIPPVSSTLERVAGD